jgi:hypothetical protein
MSADHVSLALKLLGMIRGGQPLSPEEVDALQGLTREELSSAEQLWAEGIMAGRDEEGARFARLAWLAQNRPGMTIAEGIESLNPEELETLLALTGEDL